MEQPDNASSRWKELNIRVFTAVPLALVVLGALWLGGFIFTFLTLSAGLLMLREWDGLTSGRGRVWAIGGVLYAALPCASMIWLRSILPNMSGLWLVLYVLFVVWATDIGAYFAGRKIGGPKLAPAISPGKTWAGLLGGVLTAALVGGSCSAFVPYPSTTVAAAALAAVLALVAQAGDLFESWLKRRAGVKDSGTLIPGHGGVLDRVDGLAFSVPLYALLVALATQTA